MQKVIILKGLPASGKSSWSKELQENHPNLYKRVNKDELRSMLDDGKWSKVNERMVLDLRDEIIKTSLFRGFNVIVDDTNLSPKHELRIKALIEANFKDKAQVEIEDKFLKVSPEECIQRDLKRPNSVGGKVIWDMYRKYISPTNQYKLMPYIDSLKDCYIFDIDGTLALKSDRSPYDWARVGEDEENTPVANIYRMLKSVQKNTKGENMFDIFIFSGRDSICKKETINWLNKHGLDEYDKLVMRPKGNFEKDTIIKNRMYIKHIQNRYNVLGIFDDRQQVVDMWRGKGLPVFQVNKGDF